MGFDISDTVPKPICYAEIPGSPLNQYSTDLWDGHLRVVTTEHDWRSEDDRTRNKIFVLAVPEAGASPEMVRVGESGHVGKPNESVYSVRFIGPRAYVVTFERIDPFYIYDLSDPANPAKLGELEVRPCAVRCLLTFASSRPTTGGVLFGRAEARAHATCIGKVVGDILRVCEIQDARRAAIPLSAYWDSGCARAATQAYPI